MRPPRSRQYVQAPKSRKVSAVSKVAKHNPTSAFPRYLLCYREVFLWHYNMELRPHPPNIDEHYLSQLLGNMRDLAQNPLELEKHAKSILLKLASMSEDIACDASSLTRGYKSREQAFDYLRKHVSACLACERVFAHLSAFAFTFAYSMADSSPGHALCQVFRSKHMHLLFGERCAIVAVCSSAVKLFGTGSLWTVSFLVPFWLMRCHVPPSHGSATLGSDHQTCWDYRCSHFAKSTFTTRWVLMKPFAFSFTSHFLLPFLLPLSTYTGTEMEVQDVPCSPRSPSTYRG